MQSTIIAMECNMAIKTPTKSFLFTATAYGVGQLIPYAQSYLSAVVQFMTVKMFIICFSDSLKHSEKAIFHALAQLFHDYWAFAFSALSLMFCRT